jgi:HK97 family phage prohead protease
MKNRTTESRFLAVDNIEMQADADKRQIEGYGAVFDSFSNDLGGFVEKINKNAFNKTLSDGGDVVSLINHDPNLLLGRRSKNNTESTLELSTDDKGLYYRVQLPNTDYANNLLESVTRGDISGNSFVFNTIRDQWTARNAERELLEVRLIEVGPVTFPAYPDTSVSARSYLVDKKIDINAIEQYAFRYYNNWQIDEALAEHARASLRSLHELLETAPHSNEPHAGGPRVDFRTLLRMREIEQELKI